MFPHRLRSLSVEVREYEPEWRFRWGRRTRCVSAADSSCFCGSRTGWIAPYGIGYEQAKPVSELLMDAGYDDVNFIRDLQEFCVSPADGGRSMSAS